MIMRAIQTTTLLALLLMLCACGAATSVRIDPALTLEKPGFKAPVSRAPSLDSNATKPLQFMEVYDPWEPMNRSIYEFNAGFDKYVMLPATGAYEAVLPDPVLEGVSNVIQNANELPTLVNCLLQGKFEKSAITLTRFIINSTFGLLGVIDLASDSEDLPLQKEDVGQTLGVWGFGNGPYFVMPILGPSNVRDTVGFGGDLLLLFLEMHYSYQLLGIEETQSVAIAELLIRGLNKRANEPFRYHGTGSPFEYEMIRFIYTKKRELDISQ